MARLNIPTPIKAGLAYIAELTEEQYKELHSALENIPLRIPQDRIFDDSSFQLSTIPSDKLSLVKDALFPLYISQQGSSIPLSSIINEIAESLREQNEDESERSEEFIGRFKERLNDLLGIDRAKLIVKSNDILRENARTYGTARILSDIRPVFGENIDQPPQSAVIVHMLKISYFKDQEQREFVVALDTKDIQQLIDTLERAKKKTETLNSLASLANMTPIEIG